MKPQQQQCYAPGCTKMVTPNKYNTYIEKKPWYVMLFTKQKTHVLCPEHLERMTAGRVSDNDLKTNPDLNR